MADYDVSNLRILVVDDYQPMRRIMRHILKEWGIRSPREASSGQEAIGILRAEGADLVFTDYKMAPTDGLELVKQIRSGTSSIDPFTPVILFTAYTEMKNIIDARDAGVNEFLAKPISAKSVYQRMRLIIDNPRQFVRSKTYNGPDRRRKAIPIKIPDRRKATEGATAGRAR